MSRVQFHLESNVILQMPLIPHFITTFLKEWSTPCLPYLIPIHSSSHCQLVSAPGISLVKVIIPSGHFPESFLLASQQQAISNCPPVKIHLLFTPSPNLFLLHLFHGLFSPINVTPLKFYAKLCPLLRQFYQYSSIHLSAELPFICCYHSGFHLQSYFLYSAVGPCVLKPTGHPLWVSHFKLMVPQLDFFFFPSKPIQIEQ